MAESWQTGRPALRLGARVCHVRQRHARAGLGDGKKSIHSGIVMLAVEMGVVGVALYVWVMVVLWRTARKQLKVARHGLGAILAVGFIGAIPALIVGDFRRRGSRAGKSWPTSGF